MQRKYMHIMCWPHPVFALVEEYGAHLFGEYDTPEEAEEAFERLTDITIRYYMQSGIYVTPGVGEGFVPEVN
jgi:hypothetical protein